MTGEERGQVRVAVLGHDVDPGVDRRRQVREHPPGGTRVPTRSRAAITLAEDAAQRTRQIARPLRSA